MREDAAQSYKDQSPHNQTVLRRMALQVLKNDTWVKIGLQAKRKRAGWSLGYLELLLGIAVLMRLPCRKKVSYLLYSME